MPPPDEPLARWLAIARTKDKAPPAGSDLAALAGELVAYLGSPDPVRRDEVAFEVLAAWVGGAVLSDDAVRALARDLVANLAAPVTGSSFRRSFSALVLSQIVRRERTRPFLAAAERRAILDAAVAYAGRETDLRGHTGATGWVHAAAHTADLLAQLAKLPSATEADRARVLDGVAALVTRRHGQRFGFGEDGRLAAAVVAAAKGGVAADALAAWIAALRAPLVEAPSPVFDAGLFHAQRNTRDLLFTLFVYGATAQQPSAGEQALFTAVRALVAE